MHRKYSVSFQKYLKWVLEILGNLKAGKDILTSGTRIFFFFFFLTKEFVWWNFKWPFDWNVNIILVICLFCGQQGSVRIKS